MTENKNVHQRLAKAMESVDYIQKEKKSGMNYTIVSHDAVTAKVRPVLLANGIVYYPVRCEHIHNGNRAECSMTVRFANIDNPSDFIDVPTFGYGIDTQDKGPGKAMSYAVKYALLKALGLETGDDPDEDAKTPAYTEVDPHLPKFVPAEAVKLLISRAQKAATVAELNDVWQHESDVRGMLNDAENAKVVAAFKSRKAALTAPANDQKPADEDSFPGDTPITQHPLNAG